MASDGETLVAGGSLPPPTGRARRRPGRWIWPLIAVAVGAAVVAGLFASGVYPSRSSSTGNTTPTYAEAAILGSAAANSTSGGPWSLVAAAGIDSQGGLSLSLPSVSTANCSFAPASLGALSTTLRVPTDGSFSSGTSPWWALLYVAHTSPAAQANGEVLIVLVVNGTAESLAIGSGACVNSLLALSTAPSSVVNSPGIASNAWSNGGSTFVSVFDSDHPGTPVNLILGLVGGGTISGLGSTSYSFGASWIYALSPCAAPGASGPSGSQPYFVDLFNATTGLSSLSHSGSASCTNLSSIVTEEPVTDRGDPVPLSAAIEIGGSSWSPSGRIGPSPGASPP